MKKLLFGLCATVLLFSCSDEQSEITGNEAIDTAKIAALSASTPDVSMDGTSFGLYRGVFISADTKYHGEIIVSVNEVDTPAALVMLDSGKELYFKGQQIEATLYRFKAADAFFTIDIENQNDVVVTSSDMGNRPIHIRLVKDDATNRAAVSLGTFVDSSDTGFSGTWDFVSTSTTTINGVVFGFPVSIPVNNIDEVIICFDDGSPSGQMFNDTNQESFTGTSPGCDTYPLPADPVAPFFTGATIVNVPVIGPVPVNEDVAFNQVSTLGSFDASWSIGYSLAAGSGGTRVYIDNNCQVTTSGTWSWRGRSGTLLFN